MKNRRFDRRTFLKSAVAGSAAAVSVTRPQTAEAQQKPTAPAAAPPPSPGYAYLNLEEQAFIEALVDHMVPADELSPKGTDIGINVYIDRALAGAWGKGDRLYMQGPWKTGVPSQGYQLPLTPAQLYRTGIEATNAYCRKTLQKDFDRLTADQQIKVLQDMEQGRIAFEGVSAQEFFNLLLVTTMQGFFADPVYGGNRDKVAWKMIGFPGVVAIYSEHIKTYRNKKYDVEPKSILDLS